MGCLSGGANLFSAWALKGEGKQEQLETFSFRQKRRREVIYMRQGNSSLCYETGPQHGCGGENRKQLSIHAGKRTKSIVVKLEGQNISEVF